MGSRGASLGSASIGLVRIVTDATEQLSKAMAALDGDEVLTEKQLLRVVVNLDTFAEVIDNSTLTSDELAEHDTFEEL